MKLFKKKEKQPKEPTPSAYDVALAKKPKEVQELIKEYPECWYFHKDNKQLVWVKVLTTRPKSMTNHIDLSTNGLTGIITKLDRNSSHTVNKWDGTRTSVDKYSLSDVQSLIDYAICLRYVADDMKKVLLDNDLATVNEKGRFFIKSEDNNEQT